MQETDVGDNCNYSIVTAKNAPTVVVALLHQLDKMLENVDWMIAYLKGTTLTKQASGIYSCN